MRRAAAVLAAALLAGGCGGGGDGADVSSAEPERALPRAVIERRDGTTVAFTVELAQTPEERQTGLMGRAALPPDHGMLFLFERDTDGAFWMKDTPLPLSIAFVASDGRIVALLDMEPCAADPCPVYAPGAAYRSALEVEQGAFARAGVAVGDTLRLERPG